MRYLTLILLPVIMSCSVEPDSVDEPGSSIQFEKYAGRYLLVNYWAEWCHPCLEEIPELNNLAREYRNEIAVIGVNFDGLGVEEILLQQKRLGIDFPVVTEDPAIHFQYDRPEVLPTSYLFDPAQKLVATLVGAQTRESILAFVKDPGETDNSGK
jgi:thiol-disulfide isomerase/thioredoxin